MICINESSLVMYEFDLNEHGQTITLIKINYYLKYYKGKIYL